MHHKIALIGGGNIGGILALLSTQRYIGEIAIVDVVDGVAYGKALDIMQANSADGLNLKLTGTTDYSNITDSDVVIVTAGFPRKEGMSRDDLLQKNAEVIRTVGKNIREKAPNAFVIVVTNPLDIMVGIMQDETQFHPSKVVGMAGVLDSSRFKTFLSEALSVATSDIQTFVLGGHGDSMVPLPRYTTISGIPLDHFIKKGKISEAKLNEIIDRTKQGGAEIISYLKTSAYFAPAASALKMAKAYLFNERSILPCAAYLNGEYGVKGLYVGVPALIGKNGVEEIIELDLTSSEKTLFDDSIGQVQKLVETVKALKL